MDTEVKQYAKRDAEALEKAGGYYSRHVSAMTVEGLHSKSDIAAELAWRDQRIAELEKDAARYRWLRDKADCYEGVAPMKQECNDWGRWYWRQVSEESLDSAVDAALKEDKTADANWIVVGPLYLGIKEQP